MSNFDLTIVIPTYNRPQKLFRQVEAISALIPPNWQVLVIDNASLEPSQHILTSLTSKFGDGQLIFHRNPYNIGLSGNIIRCFELCPTEYMWILSDDDAVSPRAYQYIREMLDQPDRPQFISLGSNLWPQSKDIRGRTLDDFFRDLESTVNITLISTNIYHTPTFLPYLRFGYLYAYSLCPFLAMLLMAISEGKCSFLLSSNQLIKAIKPTDLDNSWSFVTTSLTISSLLELPLGLSNRNLEKFAKLLQHYVVPPKTAFELINNALTDEQTLARKHLMRQIFQRNYFIHKVSRLREIKLLLLSNFLCLPLKARNIILKAWGLKSDSHNEKDLYNRI